MKIRSEWIEISRMNKNRKLERVQVLSFGHFYVIKLSKNYFAVCDIDFDKEITSGTTLDNASKKARLLQTGYPRLLASRTMVVQQTVNLCVVGSSPT